MPWENRRRYDEVVSGRTVYTYTGNDPLDKTDPSGQIAEVLPVIIVVAAGLSSGCASTPSCTQSISDTLSNIGNAIQSSFDRFRNFVVGPQDPTPPAAGSDDGDSGANSFTGAPDPNDDDKSQHAKDRQAERNVSQERIDEAKRIGREKPGNSPNEVVKEVPSNQSASGRGIRIVVDRATGRIVTVIDKGSKFK